MFVCGVELPVVVPPVYKLFRNVFQSVFGLDISEFFLVHEKVFYGMLQLNNFDLKILDAVLLPQIVL